MDRLGNAQTADATPLSNCDALARLTGTRRVLIKHENQRSLGNFKSLGGVAAGLKAIAACRATHGERDPLAAPPVRLLCASDGNHGLAVATAAQRAGAAARVYLPRSVSGWRVERIARRKAEIVRVEGSYDKAVRQAHAAADRGEGILVADTADELADPSVQHVMTGYQVVTEEVIAQAAALDAVPTHFFVQAGVGGLAASVATVLHANGLQAARIVTVEPAAAGCVAAALRAGHPVQIAGDLESCADMLSCGLASAPALEILLGCRADGLLVSEPELQDAPALLHRLDGTATTPSGAAGLAGLMHASAAPSLRRTLRLDRESVVVLFITEGAANLAAD